MSKEKAELLNGIMKYLYNKDHLTDFDGKYDLNDGTVIKALKGLEREGYVRLTIPEVSEEISVVGLTDKGKEWVKKGSLFI